MKRFLSIFLLLLIFIIPIKVYGVPKDYTIENLNINATIMPNGDVFVHEELTYNFQGSFSKVYRSLSHSGTSGYKISNISIKENNIITPLPLSNDNSNNTYEVLDNGDFTNINIFSKSSNENKTFILEYKILDCVKKYEDFGELYWNFYTVENNKNIKNFTLNISLYDTPFILDKTHYWCYLDSSQSVTNYDDNTIEVSGTELSSLLGIKVRFQPKFLNIPISKGSSGNTDVIPGEYNSEHFSKKTSVILITLSIGFIVLIFAGIIIYLNKRKKFQRSLEKYRNNYVFFHEPILSAPPSDLPPALVNLLYKNRDLSFFIIPATLLYLCKKGYYTMNKDVYYHKGVLLGKNKFIDDLRFTRNIETDFPLYPHLNDFISWFSNYEENGSFSLKSIEHSMKDNRNSEKFHNWFNSWRKLIKKDAMEFNFYTSIESKQVLTNKMCDTRLKWIGYRNYINDLIKEGNNQSIADDTIDYILIYALALEIKGVDSPKFLNKLNNLFKNTLNNDFYLMSYNYNLFFHNIILWNTIYNNGSSNSSTSSFGGFSGGNGFSGGGGGGSGAC